MKYTEVYVFNTDGYFITNGVAQHDSGGNIMLPPLSTIHKPVVTDGYFCRYNGKEWVNELIGDREFTIIDGEFIVVDIVETVVVIGVNADVLNDIATLEFAISQRRIREAITSGDTTWLSKQNDKINELRKQLVWK